MSRASHPILVLAASSACGLLGACKTAPAPAPNAMPYAQAAEIFNSRADQLSVVWARAVVSIEFTDESGNRRWEQGNGHLQVIQPDHYALSIGKVGQIHIWLGADAQRFWLLDCDADRAVVGAHQELTAENSRELGLLTTPRDLPVLLGIVPIPPAPNATGRQASQYRVVPISGGYEIEYPLQLSRVRLTVDSDTFLPTRVEIVDETTDTLIEAELNDPSDVKLPGRAGYFPQMPSLITIRDRANDTTLKITLSDMQAKEISPLAFDLDHLLEAYGPFEVRSAHAAVERGAP